MNLYEVKTNRSLPVVPFSHIVVASDKKQAIQMVVSDLNNIQTAVLYQSCYFSANKITVDNISEPTILL